SISVLDIFGFENFPLNSLEQLCINYANETLQRHFNQHVFAHQQALYAAENIDFSSVPYPGNSKTLDLLESRGGLFNLLDDKGNVNWPDLVGFLATELSAHGVFSVSGAERVSGCFSVSHYAGSVCYTAESFLVKNADLVSADMLQLLGASGDSLVAGLRLFAVDGGDAGSAGKRKSVETRTVGSKFRQQMRDLMTRIGLTNPLDVRCIKPNDTSTPGVFDSTKVAEQLRCCGVLEAVRVTRGGYARHLDHAEFHSRYRCLAP
ncbi:P-loop containing nucleoside triphosphate hydrolase protein, partial [Ochromonadaceae sp. CCMP2298]